jgi:hypothetical protein
MKAGQLFPVQTYCKPILTLLQQAIAQNNPTLFLYKKNVRTPLFMMESLTRLLKKIHSDAEIDDAHKTSKKLEDLFGQVDHYDALVKQFSKQKSITKAQLDYFTKKRDKIVSKANQKLRKRDFYQAIFNELQQEFKIDFNNKAVVVKIENQIKQELADCFNFYKQFTKGFDDMELQVHEMRRKLRWISIYNQSLQGLIALKADKSKYAWEKEFITKTELESPYNKPVIKKNLTHTIVFNQKAFYALSFVIKNLGDIKDKGLAIEALSKAIKKTSKITATNLKLPVTKQLKSSYTEEDLLKQAHALLHKFFISYKIHDKLIVNG